MNINEGRIKELQWQLEEFKKSNLCYFFKPYKWQNRVLNNDGKNIIVVPASNKVGKTTIGVNLVISWVLGYEPWNEVNKDWPRAVQVGSGYYKPSSLNIGPPVKAIIVGEDWKIHIGTVLVPELKKWAPDGRYTTHKNEQGVDYKWDWDNGSEFVIMCNTQETRLFESSRCQGVWSDEPMEKAKFTALSRGLLLDNGKMLMTMTPLSEAWILDDLVLSNRKDILVIDDLNILANEDLYGKEVLTLKQMGLNAEQIQAYIDQLFWEDKKTERHVCDKGRSAEDYLVRHIEPKLQVNINDLGILRFIKDIDPTEVLPRIFGKFKALVGRVLKDFNDRHIVKPFNIPPDYPVVAMIDFHLSTPQAISFWTVSPHDIYFCIDEVWSNISSDEVADAIIRRKLKNNWLIKDAFIDPLSKGDTAYVKNMLGTEIPSSFNVICDKLSTHGITLHVATKDRESGIQNLQTRIRGPNGVPTLYVFDTCERFRYEVNRWIYGDDKKPSDNVSDHFMENAYRFTLTGIKYGDYQVKPIRYESFISDWMSV